MPGSKPTAATHEAATPRVLEASGIWHEEGKAPVTLVPGRSLHVRSGTVHAHRTASITEKPVFLEFVIVEKGQRSTVPTP